MPELPDLQVFSHNLHKRLSGKTVTDIAVHSSKLNVSAATLQKHLGKKVLKKVYRVGKELYFEFEHGDILSLHLMLNGELFLGDKNAAHKHQIISLRFDDDSMLVLTDYQQAATPTLNPVDKDAPDALSDIVDAGFLKNLLAKKRTTIKTLLLDQKIIRGIGNAYADEILWDAGLSPFSVCNKIPATNITALAKSIKKVLVHAEKQIIKTHPDIITGEVRDFLLIHHAKKTYSPTGAPIEIRITGGRKTYYTKEQVLFE